jgi:Flp pilus assembly protein TadD
VKVLQAVAAEVPLNEVFNDLGAAQLRTNRPEAIENFKKALEGDQADPDYWFNLGYAQWKAGQVADAAKSFREVLARVPDDSEARALLARCEKGDLPHTGETLTAERIKRTFEETVYLQLQAELKK